jgi:hypothetical protein
MLRAQQLSKAAQHSRDPGERGAGSGTLHSRRGIGCNLLDGAPGEEGAAVGARARCSPNNGTLDPSSTPTLISNGTYDPRLGA